MSIKETSVTSEAFIGRGKVYFTPVVKNVEQGTFWVGVASEQKIEHSVSDKKELYEYHNEEQTLWDSSKGKTKTTMSLKLDERRKETMRTALKAAYVEIPAVNVTDEPYTPLGLLFFLNHQQLKNVTAVDGAGGPLVENTDFEVDEIYGQAKLLREDIVMPIKFSYESGVIEKLMPTTSSIDHIIVRTKGFNTVGDESKHLVTVHKYKMDIAAALDLISDDFTSMTVTGECLFDTEAGTPYDIKKL